MKEIAMNNVMAMTALAASLLAGHCRARQPR